MRERLTSGYATGSDDSVSAVGKSRTHVCLYLVGKSGGCKEPLGTLMRHAGPANRDHRVPILQALNAYYVPVESHPTRVLRGNVPNIDPKELGCPPGRLGDVSVSVSRTRFVPLALRSRLVGAVRSQQPSAEDPCGQKL